jgi:Xaa-Pro dipeptidase
MREIEIKTGRLTEMLTAEKLGGVLINAQHNFAWLTGGKSSGIDLSVERGACFLFVRASDEKRFLLASNIETSRLLSEEVSADEFEPVEFSWEDEKASVDFIFEKAKALLDAPGEIVSDLPIDSNYRAVENLIAPCRFSLTESEIERYRRLGRDAGAALGRVFEKLETGETEIEVARKVRDALAEFNIYSVVTLVGADSRIEKYRHPTPTANVWRKILLIGVCARREGLIANLSRLACIGAVPAELQSKTEASARIFARMISVTRASVTGAQLYQTAAKAYAGEGFADEIRRHHQGGATGYKTRDWVAHPKSREVVFQNQAFAWNPTITGTKAEETFVLTNGGAKILTASPNFPQIAVEIDGFKYLSPGILSL